MHVMIRYKLRADQIEGDITLLRAVYEELDATRPEGLRFATFALDDEGSFAALVEFDGLPGSAPHHRLASFQQYRSTLDQRCVEPPVVTVLHEVGSYGWR
ncbi:MAG: hypothetical protein ACLP6E_09375 [Acidimicrobiales bacterium]